MLKKEEALLKQPIFKIYISYLIPTIIGMLTNSVYCLVDVIFIGTYIGSDGLASLNIAMPVFTIYSSIGLMLGVGGATTISILTGQKEKHKVNKVFTMTAVLSLISGLVISFFGTVYLKEFAILLGAPQDILAMVMDYLKPLQITAFLFIINNCFQVIIRTDYNPKLVMAATALGNFANIILDYVFVAVLNMGVGGASLATALGPCISIAILSLHYILKKNTLHFCRKSFDKRLFYRIMINGIGTFILEFTSGAVIFLFNFVLLRVSTKASVAVYAIISNIAYVSKGIFNGISQAAQPLISTNYGAGKEKRVKESLQAALVVSILFSAVVYFFMLVFPRPVISIFVNGDRSLIELGVSAVKIYFISLIFTGVNTVFMYYYQSVENAKMTSFIALARGFFFILAGLLVFPSIFGENGVWITISFAEITTLLFVIIIGCSQKKKQE